MKQTLLLFFFLSIGSIYSQNKINSFEELLPALQTGRSLKAVIDYKNCRVVSDSSEPNPPQVWRGFDISAFEYFAKNSIGNEKHI